MELDDAKSAWAALDRRLQQHNRLQFQLFAERRLDKMRGSLRPLFWGQIAQIFFGVCFVAMAGVLWAGKPDVAAVIVAGVVVHLYGVLCIVMAGVTLGRIGRLDYAAPVLEIQKRLAGVRKAYVFSGIIAGLPWWFLWVPILMVLSAYAGVDLSARAPSLVWIGMGIGVAGLLATWWFHRWSRDPKRPRLARAMEDSIVGRSLLKAQAQLDELKRFEQE